MLKRLLVNHSSDKQSPAIDTSSGSVAEVAVKEVKHMLDLDPVWAANFAHLNVVAHNNFDDSDEEFREWVPLESCNYSSVQTTVQPHTPVTSAQVLQGFQVLIVDDEEDSLELLTMILEFEGAKVTTAISAEAALQSLTTDKPDILISDIGMPKMDGYMLIHQVRLQESEGNQLPAIALTAYTGQEEQRKAVAAGFQLYLAKPVAPDDLIQAIVSLNVAI